MCLYVHVCLNTWAVWKSVKAESYKYTYCIKINLSFCKDMLAYILCMIAGGLALCECPFYEEDTLFLFVCVYVFDSIKDA